MPRVFGVFFLIGARDGLRAGYLISSKAVNREDKRSRR